MSDNFIATVHILNKLLQEHDKLEIGVGDYGRFVVFVDKTVIKNVGHFKNHVKSVFSITSDIVIHTKDLSFLPINESVNILKHLAHIMVSPKYSFLIPLVSITDKSAWNTVETDAQYSPHVQPLNSELKSESGPYYNVVQDPVRNEPLAKIVNGSNTYHPLNSYSTSTNEPEANCSKPKENTPAQDVSKKPAHKTFIRSMSVGQFLTDLRQSVECETVETSEEQPLPINTNVKRKRVRKHKRKRVEGEAPMITTPVNTSYSFEESRNSKHIRFDEDLVHEEENGGKVESSLSNVDINAPVFGFQDVSAEPQSGEVVAVNEADSTPSINFCRNETPLNSPSKGFEALLSLRSTHGGPPVFTNTLIENQSSIKLH